MKKVLFIVAIAAILVGCSKEKDSKVESIIATPTSMSMYYDEESEIKMSYLPSDALAPTYAYSSSDEYVATVDENGLVSGNHVGECIINISTADGISTECTATIKPRSSLYKEPYLTIGGTVSDVKAYEKRTIYTETSTAIAYKGENSNIRYVMYLFEGGKMTSATVLFANTSYCVEEAYNYLSERYDLVGTDGEIILFKGKGMLIGFTLDDSLGLSAIYVSESSLKSQTNHQMDVTKKGILDLLESNEL